MPDTANPATVYIVDDDDSVRAGFSRLMRSIGLRAQDFSSAEAFLAKVDVCLNGCILMDVYMRGLTGLPLRVELKRRGIDSPIIVVSGSDDADARGLARQLDANFFFCEPVDDHVLIDAIRRALATKRHDSA